MTFTTLEAIDMEVERLRQLTEYLQFERAKMFHANKRKVIEEIKSQIDFYGITNTDLNLKNNTTYTPSWSNTYNNTPLEYRILSVTMQGFLLEKPDGTTVEFTGYNLLTIKHISSSGKFQKFHCITRLKNHKEIIIEVAPIFLEFFVRTLNYKIIRN